MQISQLAIRAPRPQHSDEADVFLAREKQQVLKDADSSLSSDRKELLRKPCSK